MDQIEINKHTEALARDSHENNLPSRRGIGEWSAGLGMLDENPEPTGFYVYDNNPWNDGAIGGDRDRIYDELATEMAKRGCREAGRAHYPATGEEAGYTFAAIYISAEPSKIADDMEAATNAIRDLAAATLARRTGGGERLAEGLAAAGRVDRADPSSLN